ncbi:MAG TPA: glycosyltransferase family 2 protein [Thermoanaerobaculia bacterium]|nr:glycosyltransferase family 2 protein [Thermoanaerobaculia bacterium]
MPERLPRVAAVVVNYNGKEVTLQAVQSLRRMTYPTFDLVVLDNASTDGSPEAIAAAFPDLRQIRVEVNRGSSSGYAAGMRWAFENGYDYVLLLNNDIEVEPDLLDQLVEVAESDPKIGCVGPKCYFHGDRQRLWSAGGILRFRESITKERGYGEIDRGQYDADAQVDYINGCAILIRREAALAVGSWDPVFFICVDDADFCTRLKQKGYRCVYVHRAVLYHMVAYTTGGYTPGRNFQFGKSSAIYVRRYAKPWQRLSFLAFSGAAFVVAWLREARKGNQAAAVAKLKGMREGLRMEIPPPPGFTP